MVWRQTWRAGWGNRNRAGAAAGAAAGLAAAFNTPLAAMTFVLEGIVEALNSRFLGSVLLAGVFDPFIPMHGSDHTVLAVVGMSACLGAVMRAPVTSLSAFSGGYRC